MVYLYILYRGCYNSTNQIAHFKVDKYLSTCLPTYQPLRRLIIFNLSTSLCALCVTNKFSLLSLWCAPRKVQLIVSKSHSTNIAHT